MRVTVVAEQLRRRVPGGIGTYARGLLGGLQEVAPNLDLAVLESRLPTQVLTRAWDRGLLGPPRDRNDGILHATSLAFPPARRTALTVMVHDVAWRQVPDAFPPRGRLWHERALRRALDRAARIVVPSQEVRQQVATMAPVVVIEEGCDHLPPPDHAAARRLLSGAGVTAPDDGYVLTVSTLEPRKNLRALVDAYARSGVAIPLVVAGPRGWGDAADAPDRASRNVHFVGAVDDAALAGLYAGATVFVYVPLVEGFGLPPVEAMRAGVPVIASDAVPSVTSAAVTVAAEDTAAIAAAIEELAGSRSLRANLAEAGRRRAAALTWAEAAKRHLALWEEVAAE